MFLTLVYSLTHGFGSSREGVGGCALSTCGHTQGDREASKSCFGKPVCETIVAGDLNGDCVIDFRDVYIMTLHWLEGR